MFILGIVFKGCLNGGLRRRSETDARYSQQLQTGSDRRASFKTVPPTRDRQPLGGKMGWWHGGLSRTISMISVPPHYRHVTNA